MNFLNKLADNKYYKSLMPILYGWGAALVILGALFKINHYKGATEMLLVGMSVEALIFFMSAFEKAPKQYHWEKAFPNILEKPEDTQGPVHQLNNIFKEAEIDSKVLSKLGDGMKKLSTSASQMGDVMDGTKKYNKQMTTASTHLEKINGLYVDQIKAFDSRIKVTAKMTDNLTASLDHSTRLSSELSTLSNNLNALNGVYGNILTAMTNKKQK